VAAGGLARARFRWSPACVVKYGEGGCFDETIPFPNDWCEGLASWVHGDESAARAAFENARKELGETVRKSTGLCGLRLRTRCVDAVLGNKEAAIREGERGSNDPN